MLNGLKYCTKIITLAAAYSLPDAVLAIAHFRSTSMAKSTLLSLALAVHTFGCSVQGAHAIICNALSNASGVLTGRSMNQELTSSHHRAKYMLPLTLLAAVLPI
jgi:hypothetical protein